VAACGAGGSWGACSCVETCGNDVCDDPDETVLNCPQDCTEEPSCGDGVCDAPDETEQNCPEDCIALPVCGNGQAEAGEACDGSDLNGQTCVSLGHDHGELGCTASCGFETTNCLDAECGNGIAEPSEACDASDFAGQNCTDFGFTAGVLSCDLCAVDDTGCCNANLLNDVDHCGSCHAPCDATAADTCLGGSCSCGLNLPCATGDTCCDGGCVQVENDITNCGGCGIACDATDSNACVNGDCSCGGGPVCDVAAGAECCTTSCKYTDTDVTNCGGCGIACHISETCQNGNCWCGSNPGCTAGQGCCNGSCVDLDTTQNCGSCGNVCGAAEICNTSGICELAADVLLFTGCNVPYVLDGDQLGDQAYLGSHFAHLIQQYCITGGYDGSDITAYPEKMYYGEHDSGNTVSLVQLSLGAGMTPEWTVRVNFSPDTDFTSGSVWNASIGGINPPEAEVILIRHQGMTSMCLKAIGTTGNITVTSAVDCTLQEGGSFSLSGLVQLTNPWDTAGYCASTPPSMPCCP